MRKEASYCEVIFSENAVYSFYDRWIALPPPQQEAFTILFYLHGLNEACWRPQVFNFVFQTKTGLKLIWLDDYLICFTTNIHRYVLFLIIYITKISLWITYLALELILTLGIYEWISFIFIENNIGGGSESRLEVGNNKKDN